MESSKHKEGEIQNKKNIYIAFKKKQMMIRKKKKAKLNEPGKGVAKYNGCGTREW